MSEAKRLESIRVSSAALEVAPIFGAGKPGDVVSQIQATFAGRTINVDFLDGPKGCAAALRRLAAEIELIEGR